MSRESLERGSPLLFCLSIPVIFSNFPQNAEELLTSMLGKTEQNDNDAP